LGRTLVLHIAIEHCRSTLYFTQWLIACPDEIGMHDKKTRSYTMSRIRSGNTKPELLVRKFLHAQGSPYSLHKKTLSGRPDNVLPEYKTVILFD
jgi:DNA mismatch endonuclease Vsr